MPLPSVALRYVTQFQCLQDACEDSCCEGMHVLLEDSERERLLTQTLPSPELHAQLAENLKVLSPPLYGYSLELAKTPQGACALMREGLCSLHRDLGEQALPNTCARFPRETTQRAQRLEVTGALACPEMTRLCLFEDHSLEWVDIAHQPLLHRPGKSWNEHSQAQDFRPLGVELLQAPHVSLSEKLLRLWEAAALPKPTTSLPVKEALDLVLAVLVGLRARDNRRYNAFNESVLFTWQMLALEAHPGKGAVSGAELARQLGSLYPQQQAKVQASLGPQLAPWLQRYALNRWLQMRWEAKTPVEEVLFDFGLQLMVLHFLLFGHPVLQELIALSPLSEELPLLQRAVGQTVQWFSKHLERDFDLWEEVRAHLVQRQGVEILSTFAHTFAACV